MRENILPLVLPLLVVELGMKIYALTRLARSRQVRGGRKWVWAVVIIGVSLFGWLAFLLVGQPDQSED